MKPVLYHSMSPQERRALRERYVEHQDGLCLYCMEPLDGAPPAWVTGRKLNLGLFPKNFLKHPIHLQHCHKTGFTEGAVHAYCNGVMWQYEGR